jgi:hypothetical protein
VVAASRDFRACPAAASRGPLACSAVAASRGPLACSAVAASRGPLACSAVAANRVRLVTGRGERPWLTVPYSPQRCPKVIALKIAVARPCAKTLFFSGHFSQVRGILVRHLTGRGCRLKTRTRVVFPSVVNEDMADHSRRQIGGKITPLIVPIKPVSIHTRRCAYSVLRAGEVALPPRQPGSAAGARAVTDMCPEIPSRPRSRMSEACKAPASGAVCAGSNPAEGDTAEGARAEGAR